MKSISYKLLFAFCILTTICKAQTNGVNCDTHTFWSVDPFGDIKEFQLNGGVVTSNGTISTTCPGWGLAVAGNVNGGTYSQTFYSCKNNVAFYYDGIKWDTISASPGNQYGIGDCAGSSGSIYFLDNTNRMQLFSYDGKNFTRIYESVSACSVADIAVDNNGNIWGFTGLDTLGTEMTDSIKVFNPTGKIIKQYPVWFNSGNAYGCFILNDTLYVGLGAYNTVNPSTLLPLTIVNDSAIVGTPIPFTDVSYNDLASCAISATMGIQTVKPINTTGILFPNPATNILTITLPYPATLSIYNTIGQQVYYNKQVRNSLSIDVSAFANGIYYIRTQSGSNITEEKFVVQH